MKKMSADNTIVILELNDQCRVVEMGNAEDIYWSEETKGYKDQPISTRLFEKFNNAKILKDKKDAFDYADKLYNESEYVEYGIQKIKVDKVWSEIVLETIEEFKKEWDENEEEILDYLLDTLDEFWEN